MIYEVEFHKDVIVRGKYAIYIKEKHNNSFYIYQYRKDLSKLLHADMSTLTTVLKMKYEAEIVGGRSHTSFFVFNENSIGRVKEYFESLLLMNQLQDNY